MPTAETCSHCGNPIPPSCVRCPHCALPGLFPNVRAAATQEESDALDARYSAAVQKGAARGCATQVQGFEGAAAGSKAVIARSVNEVLRLASDDKELYSTYYKLGQAEVRLPSGGKWDVLREVADGALFTGYREEIRFGALSMDGIGLRNYGACSLVLRDDMIAHRASAFEENSVLFMDHENIRMGDADKLPLGRQATWQARGRLCVAKLADRIDSSTSSSEYAGILMVQGLTSAEDDCVEVHIWGPISIRTCERIVVERRKRKPAKAILKGLRAKLGVFGLVLEER